MPHFICSSGRPLVAALCALALLWMPGAASAAEMQGSVVRVPILMYHYIRVNPNPQDRFGADLSVTPQHFAQQMALLHANGFHTVTLDDLVAAIEQDAPLPSKPIILTFDDGYADFYSAAYPVLKEFGFKATSFVITGKAGRQGYLTWDEMGQMQASGLTQFESHTVDHVEMNRVSLAKAQYDLTQSKSDLQKHLGTRVSYFCFPSGRFNTAVEDLMMQDGYLAGASTHPGVIHSLNDLRALTRVRIHGSDTLGSFAARLGARLNTP